MINYVPKYETFVFESYELDPKSLVASFRYSFDGVRRFEEKITFSSKANSVNAQALQSALELCFLLIGISYYKTFPTKLIKAGAGQFDAWQAGFVETVYRHGLSQFLYENELAPDILPTFLHADFITAGTIRSAARYKGSGVLALQSGGKDSLLTAALLEGRGMNYTPWYAQYSETHPGVLDTLGSPLRTVRRELDTEALRKSQVDGGLNGHVPVTYIMMSLALVDAILNNENTILVSIGAEGTEPHAFVGDLPVNHQWAKSWEAEKLFAEYVARCVSPDIRIGSPLREHSELRIAELFAGIAWQRFGHDFSSCNLANYMQGSDNRTLRWDGTCPKCANAFLLFAPFIEPTELAGTIGCNLSSKPELTDIFKGLLGIEGHMKPFECIGEVEELRLAYHMAREKWGAELYALPFSVPTSQFDYLYKNKSQTWASSIFSLK